MVELFLGGARSGKSRLAEQRCLALADNLQNAQLIYCATAQAKDEEMHERIDLHRKQRAGQNWQTIEEPLLLADKILAYNDEQSVILVDCLTLWLTNVLLAGEDTFIQQREAFLQLLPQLNCQLILVSNEVGQGVVPMDKLSRRFVDESGRLHQAIAELADGVTFVAAGLPLVMKP